jgi:hypothetical protein
LNRSPSSPLVRSGCSFLPSELQRSQNHDSRGRACRGLGTMRVIRLASSMAGFILMY